MPIMRNATFNLKPGTVFYSKHSIMWISINKQELCQGCKSGVLTTIKIIPPLSEEVRLTLVKRIKWELNFVVIILHKQRFCRFTMVTTANISSIHPSSIHQADAHLFIPHVLTVLEYISRDFGELLQPCKTLAPSIFLTKITGLMNFFLVSK